MAYGTAERICFYAALGGQPFLTWFKIVCLQDCVLVFLQNVIGNVCLV